MQLLIRSEDGSSELIEVSEKVFGVEYNPGLVHQIVTAYLAAGRSGSKAQKSRSLVSGGNSKPFRQKGTGRARAGSIRSPLWRGGGKIFPAQPRNFAQKVNRKMYRAAIRSILSELVNQNRLIIARELIVTEMKTRSLVDKLKSFNVESVLLLVDEVSDVLALSSRNLPKVGVTTVYDLDPVSLISFDRVLMTESAMKILQERLL